MSSPGSSKKCPWASPAKISVAISALELSARLPFTSPCTVSGPASKGLGLAYQGVVITPTCVLVRGPRWRAQNGIPRDIKEQHVCGPGESRGALCITVSPLLSSLRYSELPESYDQFLWAPKINWCWHCGGCRERPLQAGRKQWGFHWLCFLEKPPCCVWSHVYNLQDVVHQSF